MYIPKERTEKVVATFYDKELDESYTSLGFFRNESKNEKYKLNMITKDGDELTVYVHKEDIYKDTDENREKIPEDIRLFWLSE